MNFPVPSRSYLSDFKAFVGDFIDEFSRFWNNHNQGKLIWDYVNTTNLVGTTTNNNAAAGMVGEIITSGAVGPTSFPASSVYGDLTSISLTAGDWDVTGEMTVHMNSATMSNGGLVGISTTSGNSGTGLSQGDTRQDPATPSATYDTSATLAAVRMSFAATTTVYLKFLATYSAGTPQAYGRLSARRMR